MILGIMLFSYESGVVCRAFVFCWSDGGLTVGGAGRRGEGDVEGERGRPFTRCVLCARARSLAVFTSGIDSSAKRDYFLYRSAVHRRRRGWRQHGTASDAVLLRPSGGRGWDGKEGDRRPRNYRSSDVVGGCN